MRVGYQRHIVAKRDSTAASRIDTVFGHATRNDEMSNGVTLKFFCESCFEERVRCLLSYDGLLIQRENRRMYRPRRALCFEGMSFGTVVLDEQDEYSR